MPVIGVNITDQTLATRIVNAICGQYGYKDMVPGATPTAPPVPNPVSKPNFANDVIKRWLKENVQAWETNQAGDAARKTANDKVAVEVIIP